MKALGLCLLALTLASPVLAEETRAADASPAAAVSASYQFVAGDVIEVTVSSHAEHSRTLTVQPDGRVHMPIVGEIVATGRTAVDLGRLIQDGLRKELVDPQVTVSLRSTNPVTPRRLSVSLLGAVRSQGAYDLREGATLAELLAAGGGTLPGADLARITIASTSGTGGDTKRSEARTVDFSQPSLASADVQLRAGDLVIVPAGAPATVMITGEVAKPGGVALQEGSRLLDLLAQAGGATARADLSQVRVTRGGETRVLDLRPLLSGQEAGTTELNPVLQPGDSVTLPENTRFVTLLGGVAKPDSYPVAEAGHVFDLLTRAGGTIPQADLAKTVLVRRDAAGQPKAQPLDLRRMMTRGDMKNNLPLQPGDVLVVPVKSPRGGPSGLAAIGSVLFPFANLFNVFR